jgi:hypothetical protein
MDKLKNILMKTAKNVVSAQSAYQIWLFLKGEGGALPDYHLTMNDLNYVDFFHVTSEGMFKLIFVELGCLFDKESENRASSMYQLKKSLVDLGRSDLKDKIESELKKYSNLVKAIKTARSQLIAHNELDKTPRIVFEKNIIVPDEIDLLIKTICDLINHIDKELYGNTGILLCSSETKRYKNASLNLLATLKKGRSVKG